VHDFPNLVILDHPLIQHKLTLLRDRDSSKKFFRELTDEIAMLMAYEATKDLPLQECEIETPLERTSQRRLSGKKLTVVPILRAGLGMVEAVVRLMPSVRVGHIGLYREHDFILLDPMLATGGSAAAAIDSLKRHGATRIRFMCLVAAPEGVKLLLDRHPDVQVFAAALDRQLDENGYIRPGLGDAGDRLFGTR
jgi:uracil phosphoribosyltransferase